MQLVAMTFHDDRFLGEWLKKSRLILVTRGWIGRAKDGHLFVGNDLKNKIEIIIARVSRTQITRLL